MDAVGLVFQNPDSQLFAHSVFEECSFLPRNQNFPPDEVTTRTRQALTQVGLQSHADRAPFSLSYGEKRRLTLASTLSGRSTVLCLDEPTVGLDRDCLAQVAGILSQVSAQGGAVLLATHDHDFRERRGHSRGFTSRRSHRGVMPARKEASHDPRVVDQAATC